MPQFLSDIVKIICTGRTEPSIVKKIFDENKENIREIESHGRYPSSVKKFVCLRFVLIQEDNTNLRFFENGTICLSTNNIETVKKIKEIYNLSFYKEKIIIERKVNTEIDIDFTYHKLSEKRPLKCDIIMKTRSIYVKFPMENTVVEMILKKNKIRIKYNLNLAWEKVYEKIAANFGNFFVIA